MYHGARRATAKGEIFTAKGCSLAVYSVYEKEEGLVLAVRGALDHREAPIFRDQIERAGYASLTGALIVDLSRIEFISSAGMRVLSSATHNFALRDRRLIIAGLTGTVAETIKIARVETLIETEATVPAALARLGGSEQRAVSGL